MLNGKWNFKRAIQFLVMLLVCVSAQARSEGATLLIDQQQPAMDLSVGGMAIGGAYNQKLAQTITVAISGRLAQISMPVVCESGRLRIAIEGVAATGEPNGHVIAEQTFFGKNLPTATSPQFIHFQLKKKPALHQGDRIAIVLRNTGGSCAIYQGSLGNPYPYGEMFFDDSVNNAGWIPNSQFDDRDLPFQTWMLISE